MIQYYLGIPGSGKSYAGVNLIYNNFTDNKDSKKDLKKDYIVCYTNINEFNFNLCSNVFAFDEDLFMTQINELHSMYKSKSTDDELIVKCKEFNIYKALYVLDECHKYLDVEKKVLVWWLTYHRHLFHDIILITQNLSLVNAKYKSLAESFYKAKSSSLTLNQKYFNYMYYTESRMSKASFVNTNKILKKDNVFKLYKSGDSVESKNVIKRFLLISLFSALALFVIAFIFYKYLSPESDSSTNSKSASSFVAPSKDIAQDNSDSAEINIDNLIFMEFNCDNDMCSYKDTYFDISVLNFARNNYNLNIINSRKLFSTVLISASVDSSFKTFLINGGSNNDSFENNNINPIFGN